MDCTSWDCPRMATCIYTLCQSIRGFPSYIVHPGTVRGWPLAYNTLCQSIRGFPSYIVHPGTVRGWPLAYNTLCQSIHRFPSYIAHPGTVRGWPTAYTYCQSIQVTLYTLGLSEDGQLHNTMSCTTVFLNSLCNCYL